MPCHPTNAAPPSLIAVIADGKGGQLFYLLKLAIPIVVFSGCEASVEALYLGLGFRTSVSTWDYLTRSTYKDGWRSALVPRRLRLQIRRTSNRPTWPSGFCAWRNLTFINGNALQPNLLLQMVKNDKSRTRCGLNFSSSTELRQDLFFSFPPLINHEVCVSIQNNSKIRSDEYWIQFVILLNF
ncbi:uncharacterized protein LOC122045085 [Zingiber officinale]|uniref:uncharacterized protein LOC122045085 n=1 Tax=Zingiber officinale TaxID=94328 RepID=UPI001C4BC7FE|nr:uncharacterized protein LOC122045085 [Zingiber officinale]